MSEQIKFTFALSGNQSDLFNVLKFSGDEGISRLYEFNIELLSDNADVDIDAILQQPATLTLEQHDDVRVIQGIVSHFDAIRQMNNQVLYKARLVPRLWELSLYHTNEVYLDMTVPEIIEAVLTEGGFETVDYDLTSLQGDYKKWAYKCQYGETHLDFIHRLMERDGIYYYFTQGDVGEKIIFCDLVTMQDALATPEVQYSPASSLEINTLANTVHSFVSQQKRLPYRVMLKDYNDDKPSVDVKGEAIIDEGANKSSEIYVWGQNIETPEEGEQLAQVRAEQIRAGKCVYHGESAVHRLIPGYFFSLKGHFRSACNQDYCLLSLHHEGQDRRLVDGASNGQSPSYHNELMAQPAGVQYRPALETPRPEIHGVLNAYVDAESDGHYAEVDEEGRYRILLPFDRVDRDGGKASHWIRMSQPFAGENQGMHFPLRKGTEVLLTFVGGDPDRPVIAGSMPNSGAPSVINADNHTNSLIQTKAGNRIELEDKDGKNRIKFETPQMGTYMHLGAPNHLGDGWVVVTDGIERKAIYGGQQFFVKSNSSNNATSASTTTNLSVSGNSTAYTKSESASDITTNFKFVKRNVGSSSSAAANASVDGVATSISSAPSTTLSDATVSDYSLTNTEELSGLYITQRKDGVRYYWADGIEFHYGDGKIYSYGNSHEVAHWNRFDKDEAKGLVETMYNQPVSGVQQYKVGETSNPSGTWKNIVEQGELEVKQTDTFVAQNGNIYDFGGYWNYNFGNSYEENHLAKKAGKWTINPGSATADKESFGETVKDGAEVAGIGAIGGLIGGAAIAAAGGPKSDLISGTGPDWKEIKGELITIKSDPGAWVTKSYGNSYDYFEGNSIDVVNGDSESHNAGKTYGAYHGETDFHYRGESYSTYYGSVKDIYMGSTFSLTISTEVNVNLLAVSDNFFGVKSDLTVGASNDMKLGAWTEIAAGARLALQAGVELEKKTACLKSSEIELKNKLADIDNMMSSITASKLALEDSVIDLQNSVSSIDSAVIKMMG